MAGAEELAEVGKRAPGVENVFDDHDISVLDAAVDVFFDLDHTRTARGAVPTAHLHKFELGVPPEVVKGTREIAEKMDRALEDSKEDNWLVRDWDVGGDLLGEFAGFEFDLVCRNEFFEPHERE
jgi:hypothetical protein